MQALNGYGSKPSTAHRRIIARKSRCTQSNDQEFPTEAGTPNTLQYDVMSYVTGARYRLRQTPDKSSFIVEPNPSQGHALPCLRCSILTPCFKASRSPLPTTPPAQEGRSSTPQRNKMAMYPGGGRHCRKWNLYQTFGNTDFQMTQTGKA